MIQEFKNFILKGNVLELAVAVIIAGAFGAVVTSFTADILMPPIGMILGGVDFSDLQFVIQEAEGDNPAVAIKWGQFLKYIVDFLIISFVLFLIVKAYNKAQPKPEPAPAGPSELDILKEIRDSLKK